MLALLQRRVGTIVSPLDVSSNSRFILMVLIPWSYDINSFTFALVAFGYTQVDFAPPKHTNRSFASSRTHLYSESKHAKKLW